MKKRIYCIIGLIMILGLLGCADENSHTEQKESSTSDFVVNESKESEVDSSKLEEQTVEEPTVEEPTGEEDVNATGIQEAMPLFVGEASLVEIKGNACLLESIEISENSDFCCIIKELQLGGSNVESMKGFSIDLSEYGSEKKCYATDVFYAEEKQSLYFVFLDLPHPNLTQDEIFHYSCEGPEIVIAVVNLSDSKNYQLIPYYGEGSAYWFGQCLMGGNHLFIGIGMRDMMPIEFDLNTTNYALLTSVDSEMTKACDELIAEGRVPEGAKVMSYKPIEADGSTITFEGYIAVDMDCAEILEIITITKNLDK